MAKYIRKIAIVGVFVCLLLSYKMAVHSYSSSVDHLEGILEPFKKNKGPKDDSPPFLWDGTLGKRTISTERPAANALRSAEAVSFVIHPDEPEALPPISSVGATQNSDASSYQLPPGVYGDSKIIRVPDMPQEGVVDEKRSQRTVKEEHIEDKQVLPAEPTPDVVPLEVPPTVNPKELEEKQVVPHEIPSMGIPQEVPTSVVPQETMPEESIPQETAPVEKEELHTQIPPQELPPAPPPAPTETAVTEQRKNDVLINFNNVSIIEYLNFISKLINKNFIFDEPDLDFRVTIISNEPTSVENVMKALLQELRVHGLSLIEVGNSLIIHRNPKANSPSTIVSNEKPQPNADVITQVFRLHNGLPSRLADIVRPLLSELALVESSDETAQLIVTDIAPNVEQVGLLLKNIDEPAVGMDVGQYVVRNASVATATSLVERILLPIAQGKQMVFIPHHATNSVFIVSTPYLVDRAIAILQQIDVPQGSTRILSLESLSATNLEGPVEEVIIDRDQMWESSQPLGYAESTKFFIKKLEYARGDEIAVALKRIGESLQFSGGSITSLSGPPEGEVFLQHTDLITTIESIQWIEYSNSLVYTGTPETIARVTELIEQIDLPMRQVLIEMLILDTSLDDSLAYGVDWGTAFGGPHSAGLQGFFSRGSTLPAALNNASPTITPANATFTVPNLGLTNPVSAGFTQGVVGRHITHCGLTFNSIGALVQAVHTDARVDILLNPKILVEDNTPAEIFVGENVPYLVQSIVNDQGTVLSDNFEFRDVGTSLKVTPLIGYNDVVTLDILQEVTRLVPGVIVGIPTLTVSSTVAGAPTTQKSKTVTRLHVPDGYFVIMSGIIEEQDVKGRAQVPCLGGLPIFGAAFSNQNRTDEKRNLMIFIHVQIIENDEIDTTTKRYQDIFREKCRQPKRLWYEVDGALDFFNLKDICSPEIRSRTD